MASITFDRFEIGIDLRKGDLVADANRLRDCKNAFVTTGWAISKRPGSTKIATLEAGTVGLASASGKLQTFYGGTGTITHANTFFNANKVTHPTISAEPAKRVWFAQQFLGFVYVAVEYNNGDVRHHYLDGTSPTHIVDVNCPNTKGVTTKASKIFAVKNDVVRFCKTNSPRDWTAAGDAGFLPVGIRADGRDTAYALGNYLGDLVVLFIDACQVWSVDPDPAKMAFSQSVNGVGTRHAMSVANLAGDCFFRADSGYRSISTLALTNNLVDVDVGSPTDALLKARAAPGAPNALYHSGGGQFICFDGDIADVYSFSRTAKISAWSYYKFPFSLDAACEHDGTLYYRVGNNVYKLDDAANSDDGANFEALVEMSYLDFKLPGVEKQIYGMDIAQIGSCEVSYKYQYMDASGALQTGQTGWMPVAGSTPPGGFLPVELMASAIAPVFRVSNAQPWRLDRATFYYQPLGVL